MKAGFVGFFVLSAVTACGACGKDSSTTPQSDAAPRGTAGYVTFQRQGRIYQISATPGATPEDMTARLDALSPVDEPRDQWINLSPDGEFLVIDSNRFAEECEGFSCMSIVTATLTEGEVVRVGGTPVRPDARAAVASNGSAIVYPSREGPHELDLWRIERDGDSWKAPVLLTEDSPHAFHEQPTISNNGDTVVFDCGPQQYHGAGSCVCEVGTDGEGFREVACPDDAPPGTTAGQSVHQADYAPDGSIVFEADWMGERVWRVPAGGGDAEPIGEFNNDNSPCVLPDGRIASLWLNRPGGGGAHELKAMSADGAEFEMLVQDLDLDDTGLGCGR
jgi:hypothetical protein